MAYGEPFETATASLRFEGTGVRLDGIEIAKSTGAITGAACVGWDGTYSFNADGRAHPGRVADSVARFRARRCPGLLQFTATGTGTFDEPRYDVQARASTICSSATKASVRSRAGWRCAASC